MRFLEEISGSRTLPGGRQDLGGSDRLRALLDVSRLLSVPSLEALEGRVGEAARSLLGASHARAYLYDPHTGELWAPSPAGRMRVPAGEGPRAQALRTGQAVGGAAGAGLHVLCAPLWDVGGRLIGLLEVGPDIGMSIDAEGLETGMLLADQAAFAVQRLRVGSSALQAEARRRELELARDIQAALLPGRTSSVPGVEAFGWSRPPSPAGGDRFDYWRLPDGRLAFFLGDASEHGPAGALAIAQVRALLRVLSDSRADPAWLLARLNAHIQEQLTPSRFVTAFVGCLAADGELEWCSAGQGPIYLRERSQDDYYVLPSQVPPLGVDADFHPDCGATLQLMPGGRLAAVTEGILDADNGAGQRLGPQRVKTVLDNTGELPLSRVVDLVSDVLTTWQGGERGADDQSILLAGRPE